MRRRQQEVIVFTECGAMWFTTTMSLVSKTALVALLLSLGAACSSGKANKNQPSPPVGTAASATTLEPTSATPTATRCAEQFGVTRVNQLFAALNRHDLQALEALLPAADSGWDFEVQPDILLAATSESAAWASDVDVTSHRDLGRIMAQFDGFHLVFTAPLAGGVVAETNAGVADRRVVAIGPVLWQGTSPRLTERGKKAVFGGGKTAVDCETGLFSRVLLGPLRYEP